MPRVINITIRDKLAVVADRTVYVCGNSDYTVHFDFDAEWDAYKTKTARFIFGSKYKDVVFDGNECPVPIIANAYGLNVGVFAGDLHTSTPAYVETERSILCGFGFPADPDPDVYAQIMEKLNTISDDLGKAVEEYLKENPIEGGVVLYNAPQQLTDEEKAQARENIGIVAYDGEYVVTPSTEDAVTLQTAQKLMDADVHVQKIPFYDVSNDQGGSTVYIGTEV